MTSDQVVWSEQGRLHLAYKACTVSSNTVRCILDWNGTNSNNGVATTDKSGFKDRAVRDCKSPIKVEPIKINNESKGDKKSKSFNIW